LPTSRPLYRIHRRDLGAWWFSHDASGRFDLRSPRGTCYLAEDPLGSFVEVFRDTRIVAERDVDGRVVSTLHVSEDVALADCTKSRARGFGVTAAIHSSEQYTRTQEWARAFADAGFSGIRYLVSHDPAQLLVGVALFGSAGAHDLPVAATRPIESAVVSAARDRFGILVVPAPA
jgi:hypothetical protein